MLPARLVLLVGLATVRASQLTLGSAGGSLSSGGHNNNTSSVVLTAPGGATLTLSTNSPSSEVACMGPDVEVVEGQCRPTSHTVAANTAGYIQREVELRVAAALANLSAVVTNQAALIAAQASTLSTLQGAVTSVESTVSSQASTLSTQASTLSTLSAKTAPFEVSSGQVQVDRTLALKSTFMMNDPLQKYTMCRACSSGSYSCTRNQAAEKCKSLGQRLCTRDEVTAFSEMGGTSCCWGWTSTVDCNSGSSCSSGYVVFPMSHSQSTGHSSGCSGSPGGMRISTRTDTTLWSAHCCSF